MRKILLGLSLPAILAGFFLVGPAGAQSPDGNPGRGRCVSSSEKPSGPGGRSDIARNQCAPTTTTSTTILVPQPLDCTENGVVAVDEATDTVILSANPETAGSSLECTLDTEVTAGDTLTFTYDLADGVTCGGGVPRLFITIDGQTYNTFDDGGTPLPGACGTGGDIGTATAGTVTYTIPVSGTASAIGLVYDVPTGSVEYSGVTLAGEALNF